MTRVIDAAMYPHIISNIFLLASNEALFSLRPVCRDWCNRVDEFLAGHIAFLPDDEPHAVHPLTGQSTRFPPFRLRNLILPYTSGSGSSWDSLMKSSTRVLDLICCSKSLEHSLYRGLQGELKWPYLSTKSPRRSGGAESEFYHIDGQDELDDYARSGRQVAMKREINQPLPVTRFFRFWESIYRHDPLDFSLMDGTLTAVVFGWPYRGKPCPIAPQILGKNIYDDVKADSPGDEDDAEADSARDETFLPCVTQSLEALGKIVINLGPATVLQYDNWIMQYRTSWHRVTVVINFVNWREEETSANIETLAKRVSHIFYLLTYRRNQTVCGELFIVNPGAVPKAVLQAMADLGESYHDIAVNAANSSSFITWLSATLRDCEKNKVSGQIFSSAEYEKLVGTDVYRLETMEEPWLA